MYIYIYTWQHIVNAVTQACLQDNKQEWLNGRRTDAKREERARRSAASPFVTVIHIIQPETFTWHNINTSHNGGSSSHYAEQILHMTQKTIPPNCSGGYFVHFSCHCINDTLPYTYWKIVWSDGASQRPKHFTLWSDCETHLWAAATWGRPAGRAVAG